MKANDAIRLQISFASASMALGFTIMILFLSCNPVFGVPKADIPTPAYVPIPLPAKQPDHSQQFNDLMLSRNRRTLADAYSAVGQRDPKWDANVLALMEGLALSMSEQTNAPAFIDMLQLADACLASGCNDPLVIYARGYYLADLGHNDESETCFRDALKEFELHEAYPYLRMAYAPLRLARIAFQRDRRHNAETDRLFALNIRWLAESIRHNETLPEEFRVLMNQITSNRSEWNNWGYPLDTFTKALCQQLEDADKANAWVINILLADNYIDAAWKARGTSYADKVSDVGWQGFRENISTAAKLLREAYPMHPEFPDAAHLMISVAQAGGTPENEPPRYWFDRAVAADFTDLESYQAYLPNLMPRWYGNLQQMLDFGRECLATDRYDTPVPALYMTILDMIGFELPDNPGAIFKKPRIYADTKKLMTRVFENQNVDVCWMQSRFACAAYWAGDQETARRFAMELGPRWDRYMGRDNPFAVPKEKIVSELGLSPDVFGETLAPTPLLDAHFELSAPEATNVFLIGTFNNWDPTRHPMAKDKNGIWKIDLQLPASICAYRFLVDGVSQLDPKVSDTLPSENGPVGSFRVITASIMTITEPLDGTNTETTIITNYPK